MSNCIDTPRLRLTSMTDADADSVIDMLTHPEVIQTFMVPDFPSRQEALKLFERLKALSLAEDRFVYGIYLEDQIVGFLNDIDRNGDEIELGYVIHPQYKNRGFATEALAASIKSLFAQGFAAVKTGAFVENAASIRVMEKCGMTLLPQTEDIEYRGRVHRCVYYEARNSTQ